MKSEYVVHENKCKNCAAYSKQSIDRLILDLDEQKAKGSEFRKMYQNELENKKQASLGLETIRPKEKKESP